MIAQDVAVGVWFMVLRTKQWYKRLPTTKDSDGVVRASKIETTKVFYISYNEEVELEKQARASHKQTEA